MSSFDNFYTRLQSLNEARKSPVEALVPGATGVTKQMRSAGLSSAPLDTIRFIRELLFNLDVISEEELNVVKMGKGFTGKKQAMLKVLQDNQDAINAKSDEIAQRIESTLDDFISGMGANRSREEKYAAQAAAEELAAQARAAKSGKEMDDALADVISDEKLIIKASLAKAIQELEDLPGGEDISPDVLNEIKKFAPKINTIEQLESFVKQLSAMEEYQLPAAYLSSTVKAIKGGMEDIEMEDQEDPDHGFDANKSDLDGNGKISEYERKRGEAIASSMGKEDNEGSVKREVLDACKAAAGDFAHKNSGMAFGCKQMLDQYTKAGDTERASIAKSLHDHFSGQAKHFDENGEDPDIEALAQVEVEELGDGELPKDYHEGGETEDSEGDVKKEVLAAIKDGAGEFAHKNAGLATSAQELAAQYEEAGDKQRASIAKNLAQYFNTQSAFDSDEENEDAEQEIKVGSMLTTNYNEVVHVDKIDTESDMKGRPIYYCTDKDGGEHVLYPEEVLAVSPEDAEGDPEFEAALTAADDIHGGNPGSGYEEYKKMIEAKLGRPCTPDECDDIKIKIDHHSFRGEEADMKQVAESKYTTADYLTDIYSSVEPIVASTVNENGQTTPTRQYLVETYEAAIEDAYTSQYLTEQKTQDSLPKQKKEKSLSFKERFQPKTQWQLEEVRRYGL
jgi:hypothetical protein